MAISIFDLFSIGIGPSSSHTVGPMRAANQFVKFLNKENLLTAITSIRIELFGSLAFTGKGHGTDSAIMLGLEGNDPETIDPDLIKPRTKKILNNKNICLLQQINISFDDQKDLIFNFQDLLPLHSNGMRFSVYDQNRKMLLTKIYYSVGGGFILEDDDASCHQDNQNISTVPYPFNSAKELLKLCEDNNCTMAQLMLKNEASLRSEAEVKQRMLTIGNIMKECIEKGCETNGYLPGGLNVQRRAPQLQQKLLAKGKPINFQASNSMEWVNLFAIAVNEENAAGGRVVTAPTNGAAGIIPAVLHYYLSFYPQAKREDTIDFLLTAGAIAILYKKGASLSGAEVGCQGEVGVASSMAAAALTAQLGGNLYQIENAAEIAMEHHLGLTCDPILGLVQIPCIERNAMGAVKAINAAHLALLGDGKHYVSLDKVIATMKQTGKDMLSIYKETSQGGLAANLPEC